MTEHIGRIQKIHARSADSDTEQDISLFNPPTDDNPHRISLIFGRNGAGKTTLARRIDSATKEEGTEEFLDAANQTLPLTEEERARIRVFDEHYVQEKIFIQENGLDSIVMLGSQAQAGRAIAEIDKKLDSLTEKKHREEQAIQQLETGPQSVTQLENDAKDNAKKGGWANRYSRIMREQRINLSPARWRDIKMSETRSPRQELLDEYKNQLSDYEKITSINSPVLNNIPSLNYESYNESAIIITLSKILDSPSLNEREQRILSLIKNNHQDLIELAHQEFSKVETTYCPMCQQSVTQAHKESLEESIHKVLNDEVDVFKRQLANSRLQIIESIDTNNLSELFPSEIKNYQNNLKTANEIISQYNDYIAQRAHSLFTPIAIEPLGLNTAIESLKQSISVIQKRIQSLNEKVTNKKNIKQTLLQINNQIAWIDAKDKIELSKQAENKLQKNREKLEEINTEIQTAQTQRQYEESIIKETSIAAEIINNYLSNVYFDNSRFFIEAEGNIYKIKSHGNPVRPCDISTGERNILALCYFFSESGKGRTEGDGDNDPQYLVLDDPISSFDMENEIGICSLLRERTAHILKANMESKITIMTHNMGVAVELQHMFNDIKNNFRHNSANFQVDYLELINNNVEKLNLRTSEYSTLLKQAYDFATGANHESTSLNYAIGNILRRILEGYGTFNYGIGMENLARDRELVTRFGNSAKNLSNLMYRLILNDDSHMQERLVTLNPSVTFEHYSYEEKQVIAQCVFVMLNYFDNEHIYKQLSKFRIGREEIRRNLNLWKRRFDSTDNN